MSFEAVKEYLARWNRDKDIQVFPVSSATVDLAAAALHVKPERIVKTLSFRKENDGCLLILAAGNTVSTIQNLRRFSDIRPQCFPRSRYWN